MKTDHRQDTASAVDVICRKVSTIAEFIDVIRVRVDVFIIEQHCPPGWEPSEVDKTCDHYAAWVDEAIVGTARLRADEPGSLKIECMSVLKDYRHRGVGKALTDCLVEAAMQRGFSRLWMQAQAHARSFYELAGFRATSQEYDLYNLGIPHISMEYAGGTEGVPPAG